ncbi:MAG TPA: DUF4383 domain-containing protein [Gammaproteobacteria bacterium]|nr:DUF4383 domain-containing protein [Gammaproteobacteria bacterium]
MLKNLTILVGAVFIAVGILGFIPNPLVGPDGIFEADAGHNLVHLIAGIVLLLAGFKNETTATLALQVFGGVYLLVGVIGFTMIDATGKGSLLGLVQINNADNWLHIVLGIALMGIPVVVKKTSSLSTA